jgi:parallel beta-helix repeat protein
MPTIGQLPLANSVSDSDLLAIFQNDQTLAATRAQILSGVQLAITVPQNTLLAGVNPGLSAPVPVNIGANLTLTGTTLSANATPFSIPGLPTGNTPATSDLVPIGQGGSNVSVSYANFMAGIGGVPGLPGGGLTAKATEGTATRTLAALAMNAVSIEDFGAVGNGTTDDSGALLAAIASGNPVRLGANTYAIVGECDISAASCTLLGVPGQTILTRPSQSKSGTSSPAAWMSFSSAAVIIDGITFDANSTIKSNVYGVAIQASCTKSVITRCVFRNAEGGAYGSGITYLASDPTITQHHIDNCEFYGNAEHGLYAMATDALSVTNCRAHDNGGNGIYVDSQDPNFVLKVRNLQVVSNTCWNNICGIIVGNFNTTNNNGNVIYSNANPDILGALIASNNCYSNRNYGIYISGRNILVTGNLCANNSSAFAAGAGILCDTSYCRVSGNMITGASAFGIDCGGSIYTDVSDNYVDGPVSGINIGGGQNCMARNNFLQDCTGVGISVQNVESDGAGHDFNLACSDLTISGNWITTSGFVIGILLRDAPQNIVITDNIILGEPGAYLPNAISAYTDSIIIKRNLSNYVSRWAVNPTLINGVYTLVVPDVADAVSINQATAPVASIITAQASATVGQIVFCKVVNGGSGYSSATISFSGTGTGAAATVWLSGGAVLGIQMTNFGSGYSAGTTANISGNGSGATVTVQVGLPVWQNRELTIDCLTNVTFADAGSSPAQFNWTNAPITVPANASIDWIGYGGGWRAARFSQNDYVSPNGDGSLTLRTQSGDISMHPSGAGMLRIISDVEPVGAVELIGRGSPLNVVSAPPGSTFRNLNGGVGGTFWVKQAGTGNTNWVAVA